MLEKLKYQATHDALTNLNNWHMINDQLEVTLNNSEKSDKHFAVLFLDLDRFKLVNDTKGHQVGDLLLKAVAQRLQENVNNKGIVARKGGDEFLIVLEDTEKLRAFEIAKNVLTAIEEPFFIKNDEFYISTSIGISIYPCDGSTLEALVHKADYAMYEAKKPKKNNIQFAN